MKSIRFRAMGSSILGLIDREEESSQEVLQQVPRWFEEWEEAISRFRPESELNRLNDSSPGETPISPVLCTVVGESLRAASETGGLVNPLLLEAIVAAGYDRSFESLVPSGSKPDTGSRPTIPDWRAIQFDRSCCRVRLPLGGKLDLGGIAKGWAADCAAARLDREGPALVDAGGDISGRGPRADGSPWPVGVANPFFGGDLLCTITFWGGGIATSGRDYRTWVSNGRSFHHLIDPRTGEPAKTDVITATVIGPDARTAETAAKAALILGSEPGIEWLDQRSDLAGMVVLEDRRIVYSRRFVEYIWR